MFASQSHSAIVPNFHANSVEAEIMFISSLVVVITLATFFLIPLSFLFIVQTQNFLYNQTTNKRFSKFKRSTASPSPAGGTTGPEHAMA
jgi:hypothetical protein